MKTLSIFIAAFFMALSVSAQYNNGRQYNNQYNNTGIVTVTLNGNNNEQVFIDGRNYTPGNYNNGYNNTIQITDLQPGQHTLQVVDNNRRRGLLGGIFGSRNTTANTAFDLRYGYDTQIAVNQNGRVHIRETRSTTYRNNRNRDDRDRDRDQYYNR